LAVVPKYFDKQKAVSAVILLLPLSISDMLVCGIPVSLAKR